MHVLHTTTFPVESPRRRGRYIPQGLRGGECARRRSADHRSAPGGAALNATYQYSTYKLPTLEIITNVNISSPASRTPCPRHSFPIRSPSNFSMVKANTPTNSNQFWHSLAFSGRSRSRRQCGSCTGAKFCCDQRCPLCTQTATCPILCVRSVAISIRGFLGMKSDYRHFD
jgi:hypothetical protein